MSEWMEWLGSFVGWSRSESQTAEGNSNGNQTVHPSIRSQRSQSNINEASQHSDNNNADNLKFPKTDATSDKNNENNINMNSQPLGGVDRTQNQNGVRRRAVAGARTSGVTKERNKLPGHFDNPVDSGPDAGEQAILSASSNPQPMNNGPTMHSQINEGPSYQQMNVGQTSQPHMNVGQISHPQMTVGQISHPRMNMGQISHPQMNAVRMPLPQMTIGQRQISHVNEGQIRHPHVDAGQTASPHTQLGQLPRPQIGFSEAIHGEHMYAPHLHSAQSNSSPAAPGYSNSPLSSMQTHSSQISGSHTQFEHLLPSNDSHNIGFSPMNHPHIADRMGNRTPDRAQYVNDRVAWQRTHNRSVEPDVGWMRGNQSNGPQINALMHPTNNSTNPAAPTVIHGQSLHQHSAHVYNNSPDIARNRYPPNNHNMTPAGYTYNDTTLQYSAATGEIPRNGRCEACLNNQRAFNNEIIGRNLNSNGPPVRHQTDMNKPEVIHLYGPISAIHLHSPNAEVHVVGYRPQLHIRNTRLQHQAHMEPQQNLRIGHQPFVTHNPPTPTNQHNAMLNQPLNDPRMNQAVPSHSHFEQTSPAPPRQSNFEQMSQTVPSQMPFEQSANRSEPEEEAGMCVLDNDGKLRWMSVREGCEIQRQRQQMNGSNHNKNKKAEQHPAKVQLLSDSENGDSHIEIAPVNIQTQQSFTSLQSESAFQHRPAERNQTTENVSSPTSEHDTVPKQHHESPSTTSDASTRTRTLGSLSVNRARQQYVEVRDGDETSIKSLSLSDGAEGGQSNGNGGPRLDGRLRIRPVEGGTESETGTDTDGGVVPQCPQYNSRDCPRLTVGSFNGMCEARDSLQNEMVNTDGVGQVGFQAYRMRCALGTSGDESSGTEPFNSQPIQGRQHQRGPMCPSPALPTPVQHISDPESSSGLQSPSAHLHPARQRHQMQTEEDIELSDLSDITRHRNDVTTAPSAGAESTVRGAHGSESLNEDVSITSSESTSIEAHGSLGSNDITASSTQAMANPQTSDNTSPIQPIGATDSTYNCLDCKQLQDMKKRKDVTCPRHSILIANEIKELRNTDHDDDDSRDGSSDSFGGGPFGSGMRGINSTERATSSGSDQSIRGGGSRTSSGSSTQTRPMEPVANGVSSDLVPRDSEIQRGDSYLESNGVSDLEPHDSERIRDHSSTCSVPQTPQPRPNSTPEPENLQVPVSEQNSNFEPNDAQSTCHINISGSVSQSQPLEPVPWGTSNLESQNPQAPVDELQPRTDAPHSSESTGPLESVNKEVSTVDSQNEPEIPLSESEQREKVDVVLEAENTVLETKKENDDITPPEPVQSRSSLNPSVVMETETERNDSGNSEEYALPQATNIGISTRGLTRSESTEEIANATSQMVPNFDLLDPKSITENDIKEMIATSSERTSQFMANQSATNSGDADVATSLDRGDDVRRDVNGHVGAFNGGFTANGDVIFTEAPRPLIDVDQCSLGFNSTVESIGVNPTSISGHAHGRQASENDEAMFLRKSNNRRYYDDDIEEDGCESMTVEPRSVNSNVSEERIGESMWNGDLGEEDRSHMLNGGNLAITNGVTNESGVTEADMNHIETRNSNPKISDRSKHSSDSNYHSQLSSNGVTTDFALTEHDDERRKIKKRSSRGSHVRRPDDEEEDSDDDRSEDLGSARSQTKSYRFSHRESTQEYGLGADPHPIQGPTVIDMHGEINSFDSTTKHNHVSDPSSAPKLTDMNQVKRTPEKEPPPRRRRRKTKTQNSSIVTSQNSSTVTSETPEAEVKDCDKRLVFVVYGDDTNIETWIKREIEDKIKRDIRDLKLEYLHEGLETSHNRKIEYVTSRIRLCFKVLLVLSNRFEECKYCKYVLQMMVPNSTDKLIPVALETCDTPTILSNISVLQSKKKSFITLLKKGLTDSPLPEQFTDEKKPPRPFREGQEPYLFLKDRPPNPIEPHFQQSVTVPSTPDRRNDHRVVFRIGFFPNANMPVQYVDVMEKTKFSPRYEIRLKINKVYRVMSGDKREEMNKSDRAKCVRFWKDVYRQPKSEEELKTEIGFWLRFKNPPDAHKIIAYLTFDLLMTVMEGGKSKEHLVHSMNLDFETKAKKSKKRENPRRLNRMSGMSASDECEEFLNEENGGINLFSMLKDFMSILSGHESGDFPPNFPFLPPNGGGATIGAADGNGYKRRQKAIQDGYSQQHFDQYDNGGVIDPNSVDETIEEEDEDAIEPWMRLGNQNVRRSNYRFEMKWSFPDHLLNDLLYSNSDGLPIALSSPEEDVELTPKEREDLEAERKLYKSMMLKDAKTVYPKPGLFRKKKYFDMCYELEYLGDNVKDEATLEIFHDRAKYYWDQYKHKERSDERIIILLKQSGVEHYQNHLSAASDYVRRALDMVEKAKYRQHMEGRIYYYISSIYREKKKFGKAKFWIKRSKEALQAVEPGEDTAKAWYNEGRLFMKIMTSTMRHEDCRKFAVKSFHECLRHARHDFEVYGMRLETRLIRRCYLNMARICVDVPEMACGRAREIVTLEDLQMAKLYLDAVKMPEYWTSLPEPDLQNKAHLLFGECGFFYRKAEMLNRMPDIKHKTNAKKNLMSAIQRCEEILYLPGIDDSIEFHLATEFLFRMKECRLYKQEQVKVEWPFQSKMLDTASSSDLSPGPGVSEGELRASTYDGERKKEEAERAKNALKNALMCGEASEPELM